MEDHDECNAPENDPRFVEWQKRFYREGKGPYDRTKTIYDLVEYDQNENETGFEWQITNRGHSFKRIKGTQSSQFTFQSFIESKCDSDGHGVRDHDMWFFDAENWCSLLLFCEWGGSYVSFYAMIKEGKYDGDGMQTDIRIGVRSGL